MSDDDKSGDDGQKNLMDDPAFKKLSDAVSGIALLVQQGQSQNAQTQKNFEDLVKKIGEPTEPKPKEPDPDDINDLDNVGLIKLVVGEVGKVVDEKLGKVNESIHSTNQNVNDSALQVEVKELLVDNPDLMDWKPEMSALAKDNPNLSLTRLHKLARSEAPEKAEELDQKYAASDEKDDVDPGFLSLMSTGGGMSDLDSDEKPMTSEEAGEKAWEDTLEQFPALASTGEG